MRPSLGNYGLIYNCIIFSEKSHVSKPGWNPSKKSQVGQEESKHVMFNTEKKERPKSASAFRKPVKHARSSTKTDELDLKRVYRDLATAVIPRPRPTSGPIATAQIVKKTRPQSAPISGRQRSIQTSRYGKLKTVDIAESLLPYGRPMRFQGVVE
jgi:hypothetical protein